MLRVEMWVKNHQQCPTSAASVPYLPRSASNPPVRLFPIHMAARVSATDLDDHLRAFLPSPHL